MLTAGNRPATGSQSQCSGTDPGTAHGCVESEQAREAPLAPTARGTTIPPCVRVPATGCLEKARPHAQPLAHARPAAGVACASRLLMAGEHAHTLVVHPAPHPQATPQRRPEGPRGGRRPEHAAGRLGPALRARIRSTESTLYSLTHRPTPAPQLILDGERIIPGGLEENHK